MPDGNPEPPPDPCTCDYTVTTRGRFVRVGTKPGCPVHDR